MDRVAELQASIQQQSQDLRDEVAELRRWEEVVRKRDDILRQKNATGVLVSDPAALLPANIPPIRGTAPATPLAVAPAEQRDPAQVYKEQGNDYFRLGQYAEAVRAYTKGISVDPSSSTMHVLYGNRSMCQLKLKHWAEAEKDATTCVQMNRTYTKGFYRRALARKELGKYAEARADLETVLVLAPSDADSLRELEIVTELIRKAAPQAALQVKPKAKKLFIQEVEDDEDLAEAPALEAAARADRLRQDSEELQRREAQVAAAKREADAKAEATRQRQRQSNTRVEEIEEAEPVKPESPQLTAPRAVQPPPSASPPQKAPLKSAAPARSFTHKAVLTKETLEKPTRLSDVEKVLPQIRGDETLLGHYVGLMAADVPKQWAGLFGRGLSDSDLLVDVARGASLLTAPAAAAVVKGMAAIPNVDEVRLFVDRAGVDVLRGAVRTATSALSAVELKEVCGKLEVEL